MKAVTIYTTTYCPYCHAATDLLKERNINYEEIDVTSNNEKRIWLVKTTGQRTVPQIFFGEKPIGGYDDLSAIIHANKLSNTEC